MHHMELLYLWEYSIYCFLFMYASDCGLKKMITLTNIHKIKPLSLFSITAILFLYGCQQNAQRTFYDKEIKNRSIECLKLTVTPEDSGIRKELESLYAFSRQCPYTLNVRYKSGIICNSPYNPQKKALGKMPTSYLNLELRKGFKLLYSYYTDLDHKPNSEDIEEGFKTLQNDLHLR